MCEIELQDSIDISFGDSDDVIGVLPQSSTIWETYTLKCSATETLHSECT